MNEYAALSAALRQIAGIPFREGGWFADGQRRTPAPPYGAYALDGSAADLWGDDRMTERALSGTVDLFTADDGAAGCALVEQALDACRVSWYMNSIQYESDTGLTHHEWVFEVI